MSTSAINEDHLNAQNFFHHQPTTYSVDGERSLLIQMIPINSRINRDEGYELTGYWIATYHEVKEQSWHAPNSDLHIHVHIQV